MPVQSTPSSIALPQECSGIGALGHEAIANGAGLLAGAVLHRCVARQRAFHQ